MLISLEKNALYKFQYQSTSISENCDLGPNWLILLNKMYADKIQNIKIERLFLGSFTQSESYPNTKTLMPEKCQFQRSNMDNYQHYHVSCSALFMV